MTDNREEEDQETETIGLRFVGSRSGPTYYVTRADEK